MRWSRAPEHGAEGRACCLTPARPAFRVHPRLWTYPIMPASSRPSDPVRVARWGLFVLTLVNLFNYLDRFVLSSVVESLKRSALHLSDTQLGALAVFSAAIPIGSAAGYMLGGLVDHYYGWRAAFFVAGVPGLVLAWMTSRLLDPPRGAQDGAAPIAGHASVGLGRQAVAAYLG